MIFRRFSVLVALVLFPTLLLAGCDNDAEQAVEDVTGIEEGSETQTVDTDEKTFLVKETREFVDKGTGEVVGKEVSTTEVTVEQEKKVRVDVDVKSGETTTTTDGHVPEGLGDR